jgi:hypothetical protein
VVVKNSIGPEGTGSSSDLSWQFSGSIHTAVTDVPGAFMLAQPHPSHSEAGSSPPNLAVFPPPVLNSRDKPPRSHIPAKAK